jgi:hypothetical protein
MTLHRREILLLGVFFAVIYLVCSLYSLDEKVREQSVPTEVFSSANVDPFDLNRGSEIDFVDGVPIFPWARPVVILQGSDFNMGCQYAEQLAQIFGPWILGLLDCDFSNGQLRALKGYEWYIKKYAPEMIGFFEGMVKGAKDRGVILTYEQVLAQFCLGVKGNGYLETPLDQPGYPRELESPQISPSALSSKNSASQMPTKCGSAAAWGTATKDGKVITSGSSDGDDHFNVTVICFPEDGNAYIHTPYYAVGPWVSAGGHSGMNAKGLVYVHHGVTQTAQELGKKPR